MRASASILEDQRPGGSVDQKMLPFQVTGLGCQVSGAGVQVQVRENPVPEPGADDLNLGPDGRDQRPEN
jgi:hypothetical protein